MISIPSIAGGGVRGHVPSDKPNWQNEGHDWPHREASRFVRAAGLDWHVQQMGSGPTLLLLHGTGAATHSWRSLAPLLAARFTVLSLDLPGHGFTETPPSRGLSLPGMAASVGALLRKLDSEPMLAVGHSAGAAILLRMCLDRAISPGGVISLNGAILPLGGLAGQIFSPIARLCAASPLVPRQFARHASKEGVVGNLLRDTGSLLDPAGVELYRRLLCRPGHVSAALGMMANWDLRPMSWELAALKTRLALVVGGNDRTVPPRDALRVRALIPAAEVVTMPGLGHLAHEEAPAEVALLVHRFADIWGATAGAGG
jgi:putative magnesium chelatase accessory protein